MNRTLVLCVSWKGPIEQTRAFLQRLRAKGAEVLISVGVTDVALARSMAITHALTYAESSHRSFETLLLVDDDIAASGAGAVELVNESRKRGPVSGVYVTAEGKPAASRWEDRWLTGLGFWAAPLADFYEARSRLPVVALGEQWFTPWCRSGTHPARPEEWTSEDYWLCLEFGGVELLPIPAEHYKLSPLRPAPESIERLLSVPAGGNLSSGGESE